MSGPINFLRTCQRDCRRRVGIRIWYITREYIQHVPLIESG